MHRPKGAFRLYSSDPAEIICTDTELLYDSKRRGEPIQRIPLTDVVSIEVEDGEAAQARVTATRLVALGILAFAVKKKSGGDKWLMIETRQALLTLHFERKAVDGLMRFVVHTRAAVKAAQSQPAPVPPAAAVARPGAPQQPAPKPGGWGRIFH
nr:MAG TPA: hypothetical protein [Caudoviricetes sp.]